MRIVTVGWRLVMASAVGVWILASASLVGAQATRAEPRLALVIGNSAYRESPLRNPVNDVREASIDARGMVGYPKNTGNRLSSDTPYAYRVDALFDGARGVGNRTEVRPCSLTFVK